MMYTAFEATSITALSSNAYKIQAACRNLCAFGHIRHIPSADKARSSSSFASLPGSQSDIRNLPKAVLAKLLLRRVVDSKLKSEVR